MPSEYVEQRNGGYYVQGTRESLDSVVYAFLRGESPDGIAESFPELSLEQVHGAIAFYLANREGIHSYLKQGEAEVARLRGEASHRMDGSEHTGEPAAPGQTPSALADAGPCRALVGAVRRRERSQGRACERMPSVNISATAEAIGMSRSHLSNIVNGRMRPSFEVALKISAALGMTLEELGKLYRPKKYSRGKMPKLKAFKADADLNLGPKSKAKLQRLWQRNAAGLDVREDDFHKFSAKVKERGDCWIWTASRRDNGTRGQFKFTKRSDGSFKTELAHRFMFRMREGRLLLSRSIEIHQECRNNDCVNPDHLIATERAARGPRTSN